MKLKKSLIATLSAVAIMFATLAPATLTMAAENQFIEIDDIEVTSEQLSDGVTVVLTKNDDGTFDQTVCCDTDLAFIPQPMATADGELEWAKFHLGFVDWNNDTGRFYFTISADEPMSKVTGNAYVKSTSILFPSTYYSDSFAKKLNGSMNTSRTLQEDVNTGEEEKVRIGFSNVVLVTTAGEKGYFSNTSQVVNR